MVYVKPIGSQIMVICSSSLDAKDYIAAKNNVSKKPAISSIPVVKAEIHAATIYQVLSRFDFINITITYMINYNF